MEAVRTGDPSPWLPRESARPLLAWSAQQFEALGMALAGALVKWREAWDLPAETAAVHCSPASAEAVLREGWRTLGAEGKVWLHAPADATRRLAAALFGTDSAPGPAATDAAEACARDALRRLVQALRVAEGEAPAMGPLPGLGQPWSGAVLAQLPGTPGWLLLLGPDAMQGWCRAAGANVQPAQGRSHKEPLSPVTDALGHRFVPLNVEIAGCEMDLGTLQSLEVGDVVRLRHELQAPAWLTDGSGQVLFDGYLVSQSGRKALELVRHQAH